MSESVNDNGAASRPPEPRSMAARYGQLILSAGLAAIPLSLYYKQADLQLLAQDVWFVSAILTRKWDAELPYPNLHEMAAWSGITARQLERYRASLERRKYVAVLPRLDPLTGRRLPNAYDFSGLFARLEAVLARDPPPRNAILGEDVLRVLPDSTTRDYRFVARYGRVIAQAGIATIPQALFTYQRLLQLSAAQVWFICYILAHKWTTDLPYPSLKLMAARTGYSQQHLHNLKDSLVTLGYLSVIRRMGAAGGQETNAYDFNGLFATLIAHLRGSGSTPLTPPANATETLQETAAGTPLPGEKRDEPPKNEDTVEGPRRRRGQQRAMATPAGDPAVDTIPTWQSLPRHTVERGTPTPSLEGTLTPGSEETPTPGLEGTPTPSLDEEEAIQEESIQEEYDSNRRDPGKKGDEVSEATPRYSPYVAGVILDYSRELGDPFHGPANVTQALRLWQASGLREDAFVAQLHEARARTRLYQGKQGRGLIDNKMAYFFRVVKDLVNGPAAAPPAPGAGHAR